LQAKKIIAFEKEIFEEDDEFGDSCNFKKNKKIDSIDKDHLSEN
jgi:hypothetical protein